MPYVKKDRRADLDISVRSLGNTLKVDGDLNYILFAYAKRHIEPGYQNYRNFLGELNEAVAEIRRRLLVPYENEKISENGDIE